MKVMRAGLWPILALARRPENPLPDSDPVHGKAGPLTTVSQAAPVAL